MQAHLSPLADRAAGVDDIDGAIAILARYLAVRAPERVRAVVAAEPPLMRYADLTLEGTAIAGAAVPRLSPAGSGGCRTCWR
ncbi:MAG: hypothetical protein ACK5YI_13855 [Rhodospirillales bacterium]